ncbi:MAG: bacterioferritin [Acidimicrobiia bacterium]|nr:bacterioferritin [Acidimicrobiia bacterium]
MQTDPAVIELLNEVLTAELTAINQYFVHAKMLENWGVYGLAAKERTESIDEMEHADKLIDRILFLEGTPNMQRLFPVRVGENVEEMLRLDLELEGEAVARYRAGIELCVEKGDQGTREFLADRLIDEEEHVDWLETELDLVARIGIDLYTTSRLSKETSG